MMVMMIGKREASSTSALDDLDLSNLLVAKDVGADFHVFGSLVEVDSDTRHVENELAEGSGEDSGGVASEFEESNGHSEEGSDEEGDDEDEVEHDVESTSVESVEGSNQALSTLAGAGIEKLVLRQHEDWMGVWTPVGVIAVAVASATKKRTSTRRRSGWSGVDLSRVIMSSAVLDVWSSGDGMDGSLLRHRLVSRWLLESS